MVRHFFSFFVALSLPCLSLGGEVVLPTHPDTVSASHLESAFLSLYPADQKPNAVFSPLSILAVLSLAAEGASNEALNALGALVGNAACYRAPHLLSGWGFSKAYGSLAATQGEIDFPILDLVSRVYVDEQLQQEEAFQSFKQRVEAKLQAPGVHTADFSDAVKLAAELNDLITKTTRGLIAGLIPAASLQGARLVLLNALYFKSRWAFPFDEDLTKPGPFAVHTPQGPLEKQVPFMHLFLEPGEAFFYKDKEVEVVGLPYAYPGAWMFLYKPQDLHAFETKLKTETAANHLSLLAGFARRQGGYENLDSFPALHLSVPKFRLPAERNKLDGSAFLNLLGLDSLTSAPGGPELVLGGPGGPFERIGGKGSLLHVSAFLHEADISVDEAGTEAAAATAMVVADGGLMPADEIALNFNKPFLFEIRLQVQPKAAAEQDLVLFAGRVADPEL